MSKEIIDIYGNKTDVECIGCAIQDGLIKRPGGSIVLTKNFDAQQDIEIPIPGFIILASRKHLIGIDEFNKEERIEFIDLICNIRSAMKEVLGIKTVYLIQEEDSSFSHFHIWLFPRYEWMSKFPKGITSTREIMEYARANMKTETNLTEINESVSKLQKYFETK